MIINHTAPLTVPPEQKDVDEYMGMRIRKKFPITFEALCAMFGKETEQNGEKGFITESGEFFPEKALRERYERITGCT